MEQVKFNPVGWFEIYVDDIKRARKFYETVLQRELYEISMPEDNSEMLVFSYIEDAPNAAGALVKMDQMKAGGNSTIVYFSCIDCAIEQSRVEAAGGKVVQPKFQIGEHGFAAWCTDTEGNYIGLHSLK